MRVARRHRLVLAVVLGAALLPSCGDDGGDATIGDGGSTTSSPATDEEASPTSPRAEAAIADLADHLGIDPSEVVLVSDEDVTWSDSSLGCPQPGMMYAQVLTEGGQVILEVGDDRYHYHSSTTGAPFRCDDPKDPSTVD